MADKSWVKKGTVCWGVSDCDVERVTLIRWDDNLLAWRCSGPNRIYPESMLYKTELDALCVANELCSEEIGELRAELYRMGVKRSRIQDRIVELKKEKSCG